MSLKRIELYGFKSFSDHTVIDIKDNQDFVCIVGPNGCGKSNISDAIRWVLGEASAKQIRGTSMRDVIFCGSEKVKPMNFAEVTLYFDNPLRPNGQRVFNCSNEEFSIGRKIFRTKGDNIYLFNGKPCKRSEITSLFRDTGAGKDGFSIVGQGRVSDIILSKNTDRRKIFDEAAGVSKDKQGKKDTIKKLDGINQNMAILESNYNLYSDEIVRLEEEVKKARIYIDITNKIRDLELNYFIHIKESLDNDKAKIQNTIDDNTQYLAKQEEGLSEVRRKLERLENETAEIDKEINRKFNLREALKVASVQKNSDYKLHQQRIESQKQTLAKLNLDKESVEKEIEKLKTELEELRKDASIEIEKKTNAELENAKSKAKFEVIEGDIRQLNNQIERYNAMRLSGADEIGSIKSMEASAVASVEVLAENIQNAEKEVQNAVKNINLHRENIEKLEKKISELTLSLETAINARRQNIGTINGLKQENNERARTYNQMINTVAVKRANVEQLKERVKEERGYNRVTRSVLERAKRDPSFARCVHGAVGDLFEVDDKYYEAISTALGGSVNNIITDDRQTAKQILDYARSLHQGRITTLPLCDISGERLARMYMNVLNIPGVLGLGCDLIEYDSRYENIYTQLLGKIVIVDSYKTADMLRNQYPRSFKMVTLNGEYFDISGSISGGDNKSGIENTLATAKKELEELEAEFAKLAETHKSVNEKIAELEKDLEFRRSCVEQISADKQKLVSDKALSESLLKQAQEDRINAESMLEVYNMRLKQKQEEINRAKTRSGEASSNRDNIESVIEETKAELALKQKEYDELNVVIQECEIVIHTLSEKIRQAEVRQDRIRTDLSNKTAMVSSISYEVDNLSRDIEELIKATPEITMTEDENKQIDAITAEIDMHNARKSQILTIKANLNLDAENFNQRIIQASNDLASARTKLETINSDVITWEEKVANDYGLTYETALAYKREDYEHPKAKSEISKLTAAKNRMGSVNLLAEETYVQKKAEFDTLSTTLEDLRAGKADTEKLLERITNEINLKFDKAFQSIAGYFQQTFVDLFGGGKAELLLTPSENEGEDDGVDIAVQIPGKTKKSLSLLSGGEQTLTAIAIIFAVLRYKSSPFIILDEVESALDESNCVRFSKYLKEFSKLARFIVISHKKPTMANADILYGVTMMRPGISNIVSVSMKEAEKMSEDDK